MEFQFSEYPFCCSIQLFRPMATMYTSRFRLSEFVIPTPLYCSHLMFSRPVGFRTYTIDQETEQHHTTPRPEKEPQSSVNNFNQFKRILLFWHTLSWWYVLLKHVQLLSKFTYHPRKGGQAELALVASFTSRWFTRRKPDNHASQP